VEAVDEPVDGGCRVLFSGFGQARIERGGGRAGMAEQALNMA